MLRTLLVLVYVSCCAYAWHNPQTYPPYDPHEARMVRCSKYNLAKLGCHNARDPSKPNLPRAVPEMILTTDSSNYKYVGYKRSAFSTYEDFLSRFICDCAEKVRGKGYTHFSISNLFECWSGKNVANTYDMYKIADGCLRGDKLHCDTNNRGPCAGAGGLHFVYALKSPNPTRIITTALTTQPTTMAPSSGLSVTCGHVTYKLRKLGCWNERDHSKAFPELLLTATDYYNKRLYAGYYLDITNYETFLQRFVCGCASSASKKGYSIFGIRSYGQCWSGSNVACTYKKYGRANNCINQKKWLCSDSSSMLCASPYSKSVYAFVLGDSKDDATCHTKPPIKPQTTPRITRRPKTTPKVIIHPKTTPVPTPRVTTAILKGPPVVRCGNVEYKLIKLGCWNEQIDPPRAMDELLLTSRDKKSHAYAGYDFDMHNYPGFLKRFMCDCIKKVNEKGYSVFGLQFYGECWSDPRAGCTYKKFGKADGCVNENHAKCSDDSTMLCSGNNAKHSYVYVPANNHAPLCPTTIPATPKVTAVIPKGPPVVRCGNVEYKLSKLGCWNEQDSPHRAMDELLLTSRDKKSDVYVGYEFDTHNYAGFLKRFMCDCIKKVNEKGYSVFGLQFYGECWSDPRAGCTYKQFGKANGCANENHGVCSDDTRMLCSGNNAKHSYVYVPANNNAPLCPTTIPTTPMPMGPPKIKCGNIEYQLTKLGCWKEFGHIRPPRVLPELMLTAKDTKSSVYAGYKFYKQNYGDFLHKFTCDCVKKVKERGYSVFGLQFYGECWSGPRATCTYKTFGKSYKCLNEKLGQCWDKTSRLCSGQNSEDIYVYIPTDTPGGLTCPTTIPTTTPEITTTTKKNPTPTKKITTPIPTGPPTIKCGNIEYQLTKLGCWKEFGHIRPPRVLPELLLTAKDTKSSVYAGYKFYKQNYGDFLHKFTCDCVKKVKERGYSVFGLQFYGECWSGPRAACTYKTFGKSYKCLNEKLGQCWDKTSRLCSGQNSEDIYVYIPTDTPGGLTCPTTIPTTTPEITTPTKKIATPTKKITTLIPTGPPTIKCRNIEYQLTKLGCWKEFGHIRPPRVLPELLLTAKDTKSSVYAGYKFYKQNYRDFLHKFTCDCVKKVKERGYSVFGLQFYGECWSGPRAACTYKTFGKSYKCLNEKLGQCWDKTSRLCSGQNSEDIYVYIPTDTPGGLTCPSTIPTTTPEITTPTKKIATPTKKITTPIPTGPPTIKCGNIEYQLTKLGCWKEFGHIRPPRVLPELLLTAKDTKSSVYAEYKFYKQNYGDFLHKFTCDCVKKVKEKGYSVFGLQFYGECWSGPRAACTYKTFGKSYKCLNEKLGQCLDKSSRLCSGQNSEDIYVYTPTDTPTCPATIPTTPLEITTPTKKNTTPTKKNTTPTKKNTTPTKKITTPTKKIATPIPTGPPKIKCGNVEYKLTKLGCWKDLGHTTPPRAMPELLLTARDKWSNVYAGYDYHKMGYEIFINRFICDCLKKVNDKGYSVFGLQFYGECWSGPRVGCTYKKFGQANECVNEQLKICSPSTSRLCAGHSGQETYVYVPTYPPPAELCPSIPPTSIATGPIPTGPPILKCGNVEYKLRKLGCWSERRDIGMPRVIPELLLTARDTKSNVYAGYPINTLNYAQFIKKFVCDCITRVNTNGYSIFGIKFYGECWSGKMSECTYKRYGQSNRCMNERMGACSEGSSMLCSGESQRNAYVYVREDITVPTCPPTSTVTTRSTPPAPTTALTVSPTIPVNPTRTIPVTPPMTSAVVTPRVTPATPIDFDCKKALDVVIAIDASGSVMSNPYLKIRSFVDTLTRRFTSFTPTFFGLLHYNYKVIISAKLTEQISNTPALRNRIRDMRYLGQATLTQSALVYAKTLFDNGARNDSNVQKVLILFTDGRTYGGKQTLREPLKKLRESGVRVTAVAVGSESYLDYYSLLLIAENQSNLVIIPTLDDLGQVKRYVDRVAYMVCPK